MKITQEQYQLIADTFPKQRGNVKVSNRQALNGILYILEQGCKWRALPEEFGNWHTIYMRMSRWSHSGVLDRVFQRLQQEQLIDPGHASRSRPDIPRELQGTFRIIQPQHPEPRR